MYADEPSMMLTSSHDQMERKSLIDRVPNSKRHWQGFTLLEVLVALIIFSIAFGAIARIFQTSLRQSATAAALIDATALAEQQIERLGKEVPLTVGQLSGTSPDGLNWWVDIDLATPLEDELDIALYRIKVDVSSEHRDRPQVTLQTLRIGQAP